MPREGTAADIRWFEVNAATCSTRSMPTTTPTRWCWTSCVTRRCSPRAMPSCPDTRRWTGGPWISKRARSPKSASTTRSQEFPRVDERLVGRRHRYGYSVGISGETRESLSPTRSSKDDLTTRRAQSVRFRARPRTRRVRLRPIQRGRRRGRRGGDGIRLRQIHRPQRSGAARRADHGNDGDRAPSGPGTARLSRQLGTDGGIGPTAELGDIAA